MTSRRRPLPPTWRIVAAFLVAPAFAALLVASLNPMYGGDGSWADRVIKTAYLLAVTYSYPETLLVGAPAFLVLRRSRAWLLTSIAVGAMAAALPWLLFALVMNPDYAFSNGHVTHLNGIKNLDGWINLARSAAYLAIFGMLAGIVFWFVAVAGTKRKVDSTS